MWLSLDLIVGAVALVVTVALRALTVNRLIRSKLRLSLVAFAGYAAIAAFTVLSPGGALSPEAASRLSSIQHLLLAIGLITLGVVALINPWRIDRTPEHFPNIVQDAIIIAVFLVVATGVMHEKFLTTSAVGAVVIGFALQDTLGHMFAGLAIQVEKPFRAGQWVKVGSYEGLVSAITWRATRLRTKTGDAVILPNSIVSKEAITNYSEPDTATRLQIEVGVSYDAPPNEVKAVIRAALADASLVLETPAPEIVLADFGDSAVVYRIKFWIADFGADDVARDQVRTHLYYAFRRHGIEIPYPIRTIARRPAAAPPTSVDQRAACLAEVELFASLTAETRQALAASSRERVYGAGQTVVRQGDHGTSMFVVAAGRVRVTIDPGATEVAAIAAGGYFGEMSLLTGEPRTATVSAATDAILLEIGLDDFRRLALAQPDVLESVTAVVAERRRGLERSRRAASTVVCQDEAPRSLLSRVRQYLRL